jgi:hypothetical protein
MSKVFIGATEGSIAIVGACRWSSSGKEEVCIVSSIHHEISSKRSWALECCLVSRRFMAIAAKLMSDFNRIIKHSTYSSRVP